MVPVVQLCMRLSSNAYVPMAPIRTGRIGFASLLNIFESPDKKFFQRTSGNVVFVFVCSPTCVRAGQLLVSGILLFYTALVSPVQICMWDYTDPCHTFPTLRFDVFVDCFFMVRSLVSPHHCDMAMAIAGARPLPRFASASSSTAP